MFSGSFFGNKLFGGASPGDSPSVPQVLAQHPTTTTLRTPTMTQQSQRSYPGHSSQRSQEPRTQIELRVRALLEEIDLKASLPHGRAAVWDAARAIEECRALGVVTAGSSCVTDAVQESLRTLGTKASSESPDFGLRAIELIDCLLTLSYTDSKEQIARLATSLCDITSRCGHVGVADAACAALEDLIRMGHSDEGVQHVVQHELQSSCGMMSNAAQAKSRSAMRNVASVSAALMFVNAVAHAAPEWIAMLKPKVLRATVDACCFADVNARSTALVTLASLFKASSHSIMQSADTLHVIDNALESLQNPGTQQDADIIGSISMVRVLLQCRAADVDQKLLERASGVILKIRSRNAEVKNAISCTLPDLAKHSPARYASSCSIVLDPLKSMRDPGGRMVHLTALAKFCRVVDYKLLKDNHRNIETIAMSMLQSQSAGSEAAWDVFEAIFHWVEPSAQMIDSLQKCLQNLTIGPITSRLLESLEALCQTPSIGTTVGTQLLEVVRGILAGNIERQVDEVTTQTAIAVYERIVKNSAASTAHEVASQASDLLPLCDCFTVLPKHSIRVRRKAYSLLISQLAQCDELLRGSPAAEWQAQAAGVSMVMQKLLMCAVTEPAPHLQLEVLRLLDRPKLLGFMAADHCLIHLYSFLHDRSQRRGVVVHMLSKLMRTDTGNVFFKVVYDNQEVFSSPAIYGTLNPVWEVGTATCAFHVANIAKEVRLELWGKDLFSTKHSIGQTQFVPAQLTVKGERTAKLEFGSNSDDSVLRKTPGSLGKISFEWQFAKTSASRAWYSQSSDSALTADIDSTGRMALTVRCCHNVRSVVGASVTSEFHKQIHTVIVALENTSGADILLDRLAAVSCFATAGISIVEPHSQRLLRVLLKMCTALVSSSFVERSSAARQGAILTIPLFKAIEGVAAALSQRIGAVNPVKPELFGLASNIRSVLCDGTDTAVRIHAATTLSKLYSVMCHAPSVDELAELFRALRQLFCTTTRLEDHIELMRLFAVIGAIRPSMLDNQSAEVSSDAEEICEDDVSQTTSPFSGLVYDRIVQLLEGRVSDIVATLAMKTLAAVIQHWLTEVPAPGSCIPIRAIRCVSILCRKEAASVRIRRDALDALSSLVGLKGPVHSVQWIRLVVPLVANALRDCWIPSEESLFSGVLGVLHALDLDARHQELYFAWIYAKIADAVDTTTNAAVNVQILEVVGNLREISILGENVLLPRMIQVASDRLFGMEVRCAAISATARRISRSKNSRLRLVHSVSGLLHAARTTTSDEISALIRLPFADDFRANVANFEKLFDLPPLFPMLAQADTVDSAANSRMASSRVSEDLTAPSMQELLYFVQYHATPLRTDWFFSFKYLLLTSSPSKVFRECVPLARMHEPFCNDIFAAALICARREMQKSDVDAVDSLIRRILLEGSQEAIACCLALVDVLDRPEHAPAPPEEPQLSKNYLKRIKSHSVFEVAFDVTNSFDMAYDGSHEALEDLHAALSHEEMNQAAPEGPSGRLLPVPTMLCPIEDLARVAVKSHMVSKAVRYRELQHRAQLHGGSTVDVKLELSELYSAVGLLPILTRKVVPSRIGRIKELIASANWIEVIELCGSQLDGDDSSEVAVHGALAAWALRDWGNLGYFKQKISPSAAYLHLYNSALIVAHTFEESATSAGLAPHKDAAARALLVESNTEGRRAVDLTLRSLLPLGYAHAIEPLTVLAHFGELEEAFDLQSIRGEGSTTVLPLWHQRYAGMNRDVCAMLTGLSIRQLAIAPVDIADTWLFFARTVREAHPRLAEWAVAELHASCSIRTESRLDFTLPAEYSLGYASYLWDAGDKITAVKLLETQLTDPNISTDVQSVGRAHLKLGTWKSKLDPNHFWMFPQNKAILRHFLAAVNALPSEYDAWHQWALLNYRIQQRVPENALPLNERIRFIGTASSAFVAAICRSRSMPESLQDVLRLLQLWVRYEGVRYLHERIPDNVSRIPVECWATVAPQLIAFLGDHEEDTRTVVRRVLLLVCAKHPQFVVFSLLEPFFSDALGGPRSEAQALRSSLALEILKDSCPTRLFEEAETLARKLIAVAATPLEHYRELLGRVIQSIHEFGPGNQANELHALCRYVNDNISNLSLLPNVLLMTKNLELLCQPTANDATRKETYSQMYYDADNALRHFERLTPEEIRWVTGLCVCVPGEYSLTKPDAFPRIAAIHEVMEIIKSKHRPRKIHMIGSDGVSYPFLLKGNEDTRIEERVMQLFALINALFKGVHRAALSVSKFSVTTLSCEVGLLGWLLQAETLQSIIQHQRKLSVHRSDDQLQHETRYECYMMEADLKQDEEQHGEFPTSEFSLLTLLQKADVYSHAVLKGGSFDLSRAMWLRAPNAETWLKRRATYVNSLAVMSIVGYVLGLGDRHLCNLLMRSSTGQIIHVDFGDSFDVTRVRPRFPEAVPFRLSPMLTGAMEVGGAQASFRITAEVTMELLRSNSDAIVSLLSAFIYNPIATQQFVMHSLGNAEVVIERIRAKLHGSEFYPPYHPCLSQYHLPLRPDLLFAASTALAVAQNDEMRPLQMNCREQVAELIHQASEETNLCVQWEGWAPWW